MELDILQLLSAWTWSEEFDLQKRFADLSEDLGPFGFGDVGDYSNLLLRCCAAVVVGDASPTSLMNLSGGQVRERFDEIENGVRGAIDFVRNELHAEKLSNLPYPAVLAPLAVFFSHEKGKARRITDTQRATLVRWLWRSFFSRRFSAGVQRNLKRDTEEILKLRNNAVSNLADISVQLEPEHFKEKRFSLATVDTKTFILLLASARPISFVSGADVGLKQVLQSYNRSEFHHLMPQAFLEKGYRQSRAGVLANFAMINSADNKVLGGVAPSEYRAYMKAEKIDDILSHALCPKSLFDDDFDPFVDERSMQLALAAVELMS